jgi:hypothetical protein
MNLTKYNISTNRLTNISTNISNNISNSIYFIKNKTSKIFNIFLNKSYDIYLYYIRYKIYRARSTDDLIAIIKNIRPTNKFITTDELLCILIDCFMKYPLTDIELQKMSQWQQLYDSELGLHSYVTTTFWLCIIQAIHENENVKLLK